MGTPMLTRTQVINAVVDDYCTVLFHVLEHPNDYSSSLDFMLKRRDPLALAAVACDFPSLDTMNKMVGWVLYVMKFDRDRNIRRGKTPPLNDYQRAVDAAAWRLSDALLETRRHNRLHRIE